MVCVEHGHVGIPQSGQQIEIIGLILIMGDTTMSFTDWKVLKKIDAHIHILPDAVHEANPDSQDAWVYADIQKYQKIMVEHNIEKAVVMPLNDPWLMSMEFTVDAVHKNLSDLKKQYPIYAFADVDVRNTPQRTVEAICQAIEDYSLDGIKLHPNNSGTAIDSDYNREIFAFAERKKIPVAIHCYPNTEDDVCAAKRIVKIAERYPDLKLIVSHMGGFQWEQLLPLNGYVDLSAILPDYVYSCGIPKTNEILRAFGTERLLFATDYPDNRYLQPGQIYDSYYDALNQMDFTQKEAEQIAYGNVKEILR